MLKKIITLGLITSMLAMPTMASAAPNPPGSGHRPHSISAPAKHMPAPRHAPAPPHHVRHEVHHNHRMPPPPPPRRYYNSHWNNRWHNNYYHHHHHGHSLHGGDYAAIAAGVILGAILGGAI